MPSVASAIPSAASQPSAPAPISSAAVWPAPICLVTPIRASSALLLRTASFFLILLSSPVLVSAILLSSCAISTAEVMRIVLFVDFVPSSANSVLYVRMHIPCPTCQGLFWTLRLPS